MPTSQATAVWEGKLKDGKGNFRAASGAFNGPYTFATRFEGKQGTNPEELIAAAHAACLSMALSAGLEKAGKPVTRSTAAMTSFTDCGVPVPRLYAPDCPVRASSDSARTCASARSVT